MTASNAQSRRKVVFVMNISLDGYMEDTNGSLEWNLVDEEFHRYFNEQEKDVDYHLYGRRLYELMNSYWPTVDQDPAVLDFEVEYGRYWKQVPNIVFSTTLKQVSGDDRLISENIAEEVEKLKAQPGRRMDAGGAELGSALINMGLVDEVGVFIHPVILGAGKKMFINIEPRRRLELLDTVRFGSGVVGLRYRVINET
ncbi:MAG: dihydrofolate reductase family protein [Anaerolineae bacterium]|nr:dihydrofolate reductase family protein [Anaerolineae bacterium]